MKNTALAIGVIVLFVGALWFFARQAAAPHSVATHGTKVEEPAPTPFMHEGTIVKDLPGLPEGVWHLEYEEPGAPGKLIPLLFSPKSECIGKTASGVCNPSKFIHGRAARVEGVVVAEKVRVYTMTFTQPVTP